MKIEIRFKSSSEYVYSVCSLCGKFNNFSKAEISKNENILVTDIIELSKKLREFSLIIQDVSRWKRTMYFVDGRATTEAEITGICSKIECYNVRNIDVLPDEHCFKENGWGCKFLTNISLRTNNHYVYGYHSKRVYWYDFGRFSDGLWVIEKDKIKNLITNEAEQKLLCCCPSFDVQKVLEVVENLPAEINVGDETGEWEYKYRDSIIGINRAEIIGVQPKRKQTESGNLGFSINLNLGNTAEEEQERSVPDISFDDIGGVETVIQQIREVIELPIISPNIFNHYGISPHKGVLLYGPPGCGKTLIAKAIANEVGAHFIAVNGPEILNKYLGESEKKLRNIFEEAQKCRPSIIYFDEFDSISSNRDDDATPLRNSIVNQLLTLMDGMNERDKICIIASTNRIEMIDGAILRPGRFDYKIRIDKPTLEGCKKIFQIHTAKMPIESRFDKDDFVYGYLQGLSGADIAFVATEAAYNSIRRTIDFNRIFSCKEVYEVDSGVNIVIESDFLKAVSLLKDSEKKVKREHMIKSIN